VVDPDAGVVMDRVPIEVEHGAPGAHRELTGAVRTPGGLLLQAAHTEVLWIDPETFSVVRRVTHPRMHGVHSAAPGPAGTVVLTCAGTDTVLVLDRTGALRSEHYLGPQGGDARFRGLADLRLCDHDAFKPHAVHPNHAAWVGDDLWVTRFEDRRCSSLTTQRVIPLAEGIPHDGRLRDGLMWFTQVQGRVIGVDPVTLQRRVELDLAALTGERRMLGWCRGVEVCGDRLFVGFTMLRRTRHREVLRQVWRGLRGRKLPTRVMEIDRRTHEVVRQIELGTAAGGTIYAINAV